MSKSFIKWEKISPDLWRGPLGFYIEAQTAGGYCVLLGGNLFQRGRTLASSKVMVEEFMRQCAQLVPPSALAKADDPRG